MTTLPRAVVVSGLLVLMTVFGLTAVAAVPEGGQGIGIWPVAFGTAALMVSPRPPTWVMAALLAALAGATAWGGGQTLGAALGLGVGLAAQMVVTWHIACRGQRDRAPLLTLSDLARFLLAVGSGAVVMAVATTATGVLTGSASPLLLALAAGSTTLASQLTLLPFVCRFRNHPPVAGPVERAAQWSLLLAVTVAVFVPTNFPSLVLLVVPVLAWGAVRNGSYEALAQMAVAVGVAVPMTTAGRGPFARPDLYFDVPVGIQGVLLASFATVCSLVVLTLRLTVGEQFENARQVAAERDRMQNVVDGIEGVAIIGADLEGRITLFNPGAQRLLGYAAEDVLGKPSRMLHSDRGIAAKAKELGVPDDFSLVAQSLMGRGPVEMGFVRKDGEERQHWMSLNRVTDDRGQVIGYVSTSEDITERLQAEARLVEALETERRAVEQLREVDRVKDAFVSSVSHELRTPITSIRGYTELLVEGDFGELGPRQLDAARRIGANSTRLLSLISELLTLSKLQARGLDQGGESVDLSQVVIAGLAVLAPTVAGREVELVVDVPPGRVLVPGDRDMLERVVINLTDNALKFTPDGGHVRIALSEDEDAAVLEICDTGIGIPAHEQQRLFDRFFRSSLALQSAIPGSGLGLSIVHNIVERHGGALEVRSAAGQGSTFRVRLPLAS